MHNGIKFILSERFCQDDLENYFGGQRAIGSRKDNPSVKDVGYNDNTIKSQFSIRPIAGNVHGNGNKFNIIDETPLPKRKKLQQSSKGQVPGMDFNNCQKRLFLKPHINKKRLFWQSIMFPSVFV